MAWDPNVKGNPAWLTKQASEHGGVDNFIDDIHNEGYQEGHGRGMIDGAGVTTVAITFAFGAYEGIKYLVKKHKAKKQSVRERAKSSEAALREMYHETENCINDEEDFDTNSDNSKGD